jgi:hypothetical protein
MGQVIYTEVPRRSLARSLLEASLLIVAVVATGIVFLIRGRELPNLSEEETHGKK